MLRSIITTGMMTRVGYKKCKHFVSHKIIKDRDKLENSSLENIHNMTKSIEERKRIWHACVRFVRN